MQGAVWSETGGSGECRQVALRHEELVECFAGGCSVADSFDDDSGCIISLHGEERGGGLKALMVPLNELLHGGIRAVGEEAVHECCAVHCPVGGAGKVL